MILSQINNVKPEPKPNNDSTADNSQVAPAIGNTNVVRCFDFRVSKCCGKHGWVLKYDGRASGTNYYDAEKEGICPKCEQPAIFISQDDFNTLKIKQNEPINQIS